MESHLHVMNTLPCPVIVKIPGIKDNKSPDGYLHYDINEKANDIIYDLEAKKYEVIVKQTSQKPECKKYKEAKFTFSGEKATVTEYLLEAGPEDTIKATKVLMEGEPEKTEITYPKLKFILNYPKSKESKIRLQSDVGDKEYVEIAQNDGDLSETNYTSIYPQTYE